jgi:NAD(P)H dehydrogenase (quinone)
VIATILVDPARHRGKTYVPTGSRAITMAEMAAIFARVLGRPIEYVDLPVPRWTQALAQFQMTPYLIEYLASVAVAHQQGQLAVETDVVRQIVGSPPKSPESFIAERRAAFGG